MRFFEIDHPAIARLKAKGINAMGFRDNLFLIAEDLGKRELVNVLNFNESWNQSAQTVMVAGGLVMYLPPEAVQDLFRQCAVIAGVGSRIAFTYIPTGADGRPDASRWTGLMLWLQKVIGEPWIWSIRPEELGLFLAKTGWTNSPALARTTRKHGVEFYAVATKKHLQHKQQGLAETLQRLKKTEPLNPLDFKSPASRTSDSYRYAHFRSVILANPIYVRPHLCR